MTLVEIVFPPIRLTGLADGSGAVLFPGSSCGKRDGLRFKDLLKRNGISANAYAMPGYKVQALRQHRAEQCQKILDKSDRN